MRCGIPLMIRSALICRNSVTNSAVKTGSIATELYLEPSKWRALKPEQIFSLYQERVVRLGSEYKPCKEELDALLSTAETTGVSPKTIRNIYYGGEQAAYDATGANIEDDFKPSPFMFDDLPSQAQALVQQHREQRFYNRLAAYELPKLVQYRQEYKRPSQKTHPVTYRYTTYIGEEHPNSRKVVVSLKTQQLGLNDKEVHKFRLLARTRYDHTTDIFKMSSDRYPEAAQNARYLSDKLQALIKEAKDTSDDFSDVPLDTRHTTARNLRRKTRGYKFPEEWKRPQDAPKEMVNVAELIQKTL
ncbi:mitochondrial 37S ribosomal protein mS35 [Lachancea thermotolerans CBS 6340]|uniref:Small ribosomal subunit protein mS35 n=1 Tax=Lachancea thermotolerans (strain ATCC 56472 / CBS 6340 / NRRL Y-8284) TaxID=559295 RepID=C5DL07_LACTC|nr:mitochondrial 37S ribosomal protein RSM24 [Lachancea thermotolerans CBS 6340]CAR24158.1 KLTH0F08998p [Lachancea thermotolerans CBS 6340]